MRCILPIIILLLAGCHHRNRTPKPVTYVPVVVAAPYIAEKSELPDSLKDYKIVEGLTPEQQLQLQIARHRQMAN